MFDINRYKNSNRLAIDTLGFSVINSLCPDGLLSWIFTLPSTLLVYIGDINPFLVKA